MKFHTIGSGFVIKIIRWSDKKEANQVKPRQNLSKLNSKEYICMYFSWNDDGGEWWGWHSIKIYDIPENSKKEEEEKKYKLCTIGEGDDKTAIFFSEQKYIFFKLKNQL